MDDVYTFPCSFAQQRLWVVNQLAPNNPFYNIHAAVKIPIRLDGSLVRDALNALVQRHETLRTTLKLVGDEPVQRVSSTVKIEVPVIDLSHLPKTEREIETLRLAEAEAQQTFDIETGPLLRAKVLRLGPSSSVLLLTIHHIIADAWSMGVLFREFSEIYTAYATNRQPTLAELPIQYADFAVWQRNWLSGDFLEEQLAYWRERLAGAPTLELPTDRPRPPIASYRGHTFNFALPKDVSERVIALSRRLAATPFMTLLAVFIVLLHRYSGQDDIVVGIPIANRNRPELESLIGFFVNSLAMRIDAAGDPSFWVLLQRVRDIAFGAYAHQDLPFEKLVVELEPERNLSHNPIFQVTFQVLNTPAGVGATVGGEVVLEVQRGAANFDLGMDLWETPNGFRGRVDYASDLFDHSTIVRLVGHFQRLVEQATQNPQQPISRLDLLSEAERRTLIETWSEVTTHYPRHATIHGLFAEQVASTPAAIALECGGTQMSYAELNQRANRLAHQLIALDIRPEEPVGVCFERSAEMVIALLAILKAGGAYVALDPSYPPARLSFIAQDANLRMTICALRYTDLVEAQGIRCITLESSETIGRPDTNPPERTQAAGLAYVAYTSGSTGEPKGVCALHRGAVRLVRNTNYASFHAGDNFLLFAPLAFDASTLEIWGALLNGARLVVFPAEPPSLEALAAYIVQHDISVLWLTAGLFNQMAELHAGALASVRQLFAGGDVLSPASVRAVLAQPGAHALINGYGPTEGTTFTCCHVMTDAQTVRDRVPIGTPIANTRIYVLDHLFQPVPIGVPGELFIGGDGVARGYLNRAELNNERFILDPFDPGGQEHLYRTGDLVRWRPDGYLDFLGRLDRQVKVRGFRVEPGEVEAALEKHPAIRASTVIARPDHSGDKRLAAYVVTDDPNVSITNIRNHLARLLPAYLIPSEIVLVDRLPLNANGKVDLNALLAVAVADNPKSAAPEGEFETLIAEIWTEVLGLPEIGAEDNFFTDLSGHSLLATRVISRLRTALDLEVPLRTIFEHPTLRDFALVVEELLITEIEVATDVTMLQAVPDGR